MVTDEWSEHTETEPESPVREVGTAYACGPSTYKGRGKRIGEFNRHPWLHTKFCIPRMILEGG